MTKIVYRIGLLFICMALSCAHQIPPSGGPDDKAPPVVKWSQPLRGAVHVPVKTKITLEFAEWITPTGADRFVTVFPPPPGGVTVRVTGTRLVIEPKNAFADSTTYHVEVNNGLLDLHGNSIGTPYQLYFSTGGTIDSGRIFGCVIQQGSAKVQPKVALFSAKATDASDTAFFGQPAYLTQTDSSGTFLFDNIHRGEYDIVAFVDDGGDNRLNPREHAFAPVQRRVKLDRSVGPLTLYPIECDTVALKISVVKPVSRTFLYCEWTGGLALVPPLPDSQWRVETMDGKRRIQINQFIPLVNFGSGQLFCEHALRSASVKGTVSAKSGLTRGTVRRFFVGCSDTVSMGSYRLIVPVYTPVKNGPKVRTADTLRFNGLVARDTTVPVVKGMEPRGASDLFPAITIAWSRPVRAALSTWRMSDSLKDTVPLSILQGYGDTTFIAPLAALKPDQVYTCVFPDSMFSDINGNHPADTADIKLRFASISEDALCYSLSGGSRCLSSDKSRIWRFVPVGGGNASWTNDSIGLFRFDSLPASKGVLEFFSDADADNRQTPGSLIPWVAPEPFFTSADTVEARKKWDIEGVVVAGACDVCIKKATVKSSADSVQTIGTVKSNSNKGE